MHAPQRTTPDKALDQETELMDQVDDDQFRNLENNHPSIEEVPEALNKTSDLAANAITSQ